MVLSATRWRRSRPSQRSASMIVEYQTNREAYVATRAQAWALPSSGDDRRSQDAPASTGRGAQGNAGRRARAVRAGRAALRGVTGHDAGRPGDRPGVGRDGLRHAPRRAPEWRVHALPRLRGARQHGLGPRVPRSRCSRLGRPPLRLRRARPPSAHHVGARRGCPRASGPDSLCRPDCAGLCPVCGKDLNVEPHEHLERDPDPRWAALEGLKETL